MPPELVAALGMQEPWITVLGKSTSALTPEKTASLQGSLRRYFESLLALTEALTEGHAADIRLVGLDLAFSSVAVGYGRVVNCVGGPIDDVLYFQVLNLTHAVGLNRVRRCECGNVFVKSGRGLWCTPACGAARRQREKRKRDREAAQRALKLARRGLHGKATR